jgi:hypothetical protein
MNAAEKLALLRRYEPILRFTRGESFFPCDVDRYVAECGLYVQVPRRPVENLVTEGKLTLAHLDEARDHGPRAVYFLKFIDPLNLAEMARYRLQQGIEDLRDRARRFSAGRARLARVGYSSRILDAIYTLTLLLRGRVPGDTAAAAALTYAKMQRVQEGYAYYGRVIQDAGWTILQYWLFYPYNNWRSGFHGVNDHEADWEMVNIYLAAERGRGLAPRWVAYASHDFSGDDLRRRWDDAELEKVDGHPVIYVGAGSHASYFVPGEYLTEIELPFMAPLVRVQESLQRFMAPPSSGHAVTAEPELPAVLNLLRIPFVDYARGDGVSLGPGLEKVWQAVLLDPVPAWVERYRGLWGLFVRDPVAGEDAPSGPMYNRDGSVRRAWADPLGWAGLDKVLPPTRLTPALRDEIRASRDSVQRMTREIVSKRRALQRLGLRLAAVEPIPFLTKERENLRKEARVCSRELSTLQVALARQRDTGEALRAMAERVRQGQLESPRTHLTRTHRPMPSMPRSMSVLADAWSSISISFMLLGLAALLIAHASYWVLWLVAIVVTLGLVEAGLRRQFQRYIGSLAMGLAVVTTLLLVGRFYTQIIAGVAIAAALYLMWEYVRELAS